MTGRKTNRGYMSVISVRKYCQKGQKTVCVHRFIWECFNGLLPEGNVIDHINSVKDDNRLCNLQSTTQQENCEKAAKNRDYSFAAKNHKNKKCVKAINQNTNEITYFKSLYAAQQKLGINAGRVKMVCEGLNRCKSGISKKDNNAYKFEYNYTRRNAVILIARNNYIFGCLSNKTTVNIITVILFTIC